MNNNVLIEGCTVPEQHIRTMTTASVKIDWFGRRLFTLKAADNQKYEWTYEQILKGALQSQGSPTLLQKIVDLQDIGYENLGELNILARTAAEWIRAQDLPQQTELIKQAQQQIISSETKEDLINLLKQRVPRNDSSKFDCLEQLHQMTPEKGKKLYPILNSTLNIRLPQRRENFYEKTFGAKEHGFIQLQAGNGNVFSLPLLVAKASSQTLYDMLLDIDGLTSEPLPIPSLLFGAVSQSVFKSG